TLDLTMAECWTVGVKAGVAPQTLVDVFTNAALGHMMSLKVRLPATYLRGNFDPRFSLTLARKDLGLALGAARAYHHTMRLGALSILHTRLTLRCALARCVSRRWWRRWPGAGQSVTPRSSSPSRKSARACRSGCRLLPAERTAAKKVERHAPRGFWPGLRRGPGGTEGKLFMDLRF